MKIYTFKDSDVIPYELRETSFVKIFDLKIEVNSKIQDNKKYFGYEIKQIIGNLLKKELKEAKEKCQ